MKAIHRRFLPIAACLTLLVTVAGKPKEPIPLYKNPQAPIEKRVQDLLRRMTTEEKVGQLATLLGWEMYDKKGDVIEVSEKFKQAIRDQKIGMLWATLRADPWTQKTLTTGLNPTQAAQATNAIQKYAIENTRLGIPLLLAEECPHGHMAIGTTVFPTALGQGSTWDPALIQQMATAIAQEARLQGAHVGYGPVLDLAREPRWSRVEETYGEDPVLTSQMGMAVVRGFQGKSISSGVNIMSTLKHFAAYGVPEGGHNGGSVSPGFRDLHQAYLPAFRAAVGAGALSVMTAYNSIDGVPCTANAELLKTVLRDQWGFKGFTVSDLTSITGLYNRQHVAATAADAAALAINSGLDTDLSGYGFGKSLLEAIRQKKVPAAVLDTAVSRVLRQKFAMGLFDNPYVVPEKTSAGVKNADHVQLARRVAQESVVLLKNENNLLPLAKTLKHIAVIGPNADNVYNQLGDYTAPQPDGAVTTVLQGIRAKFGPGVTVTYAKGCSIRDTSSSGIAEAVATARQADVVVLVLGGSSARDFKTEYQTTGAATVNAAVVSDMESGEGFDRSTLDLMGRQQELLEAVVKTGKPVVLIHIQGRPLNMNWAAAHVPAILTAWYPGQEGGNALADVLAGDYNPAGRLPLSIPKSVGQLPVYYNALKPENHGYVEVDAKPLFAFGYGLSYTTFDYRDLSINVSSAGQDITARVSFTVKNTGQRDGDEVVQLYVNDKVSSVVGPIRQLKKFQRVPLTAGEQKTIVFDLKADDLKFLNVDKQWVAEQGTFAVQIGSSSDAIKLTKDFLLPRTIYIKN
ncbi:glycoside hydrolase family 3 N-terminal domain-containing protein [Spirosoma aerophilum]